MYHTGMVLLMEFEKSIGPLNRFRVTDEIYYHAFG